MEDSEILDDSETMDDSERSVTPVTSELCVAVDIGGSKLGAALVTAQGRLLGAASAPTPDVGGADQLFEVLLGLVAPMAARAGGRALVCGVGCGGPMAPGGASVSPLNIMAWSDFPLRDRLSEALGLPTYVDNDAKALALGEGWKGAAAASVSFMAMVVSTGVGGGIVLDGRLLEGRCGNAGHIGHLVVEPDGRPCSCGGLGCLEAEASGGAIARATGRPPALAGPEVVERSGRLVGRAVADVANLLDLDIAVVAGSVALGFGSPFFESARKEIALRSKLDFSRGTKILPAGLGHDGPLVGAAAVGWRGLGLLDLYGD